MLSSDGFRISKRMARLPLGFDGRNSFLYWADFQRQWEWSYSSAKAAELIGSQSMPPGNLPDVQAVLGKLTEPERQFADRFGVYYRNLARLLTSLDVPVRCEPDLYETLLDLRQIRQHVKFPCRILDIGPGAGRHMAAAFLDPALRGSLYAGVESAGLCYGLQSLAAGLIQVGSPTVKVIDAVDCQFARRDIPPMASAGGDAIYHVPLWAADLLPERSFDLILCTYVLDEFSPDDFLRVVAILRRCLADDGVIYCRGSQQRAMLRNMYLYGYGTFHGLDITKSVLAGGMRVQDCRLIASQLTRLFVRQDSTAHRGADGPYAGFTEDIPLVEAAQRDYVQASLARIRAAGQSVVVWGDPGYEHFGRHIAPATEGLKLLGLTHRAVAAAAPTPFEGLKECPPRELPRLNPDVIVIASMRDKSILRQLREIFGPGEFQTHRSFNYPVTFAHRRHQPEVGD